MVVKEEKLNIQLGDCVEHIHDSEYLGVTEEDIEKLDIEISKRITKSI